MKMIVRIGDSSVASPEPVPVGLIVHDPSAGRGRLGVGNGSTSPIWFPRIDGSGDLALDPNQSYTSNGAACKLRFQSTSMIINIDGTDYEFTAAKLANLATGGQVLSGAYDMAFRFNSTPEPSEVIDYFMITSPYTFKAGMPGSIGTVATPPLATYITTLRYGGTPLDPASGTIIGWITVSTAGVVTFSTSGGVDVVAPIGLIKWVAPTPLDTGISGLAATIKA